MSVPHKISTIDDLLVEYLLQGERIVSGRTTIKSALKRLRNQRMSLHIAQRIEQKLMGRGVFFHYGDDRVYFQASRLALFARERMGHKSGFTTEWVDEALSGLSTRRRRLPFINKLGEYDDRLAVGLAWDVLSEYISTAEEYERDPLSRYPGPEDVFREILHARPPYSRFPDAISALNEWRESGPAYRKTFEARALETFGLRYHHGEDAVICYPDHLLENMRAAGRWGGYDAAAVKGLLLGLDGARWARSWTINRLKLRGGQPLPSGFANEALKAMAAVPWAAVDRAAGVDLERECYFDQQEEVVFGLEAHEVAVAETGDL